MGKNHTRLFLLLFLLLVILSEMARANPEPPVIKLRESGDQAEAERLIRQILPMDGVRRIEFVSRFLLGRKYRPETKERIKKQTRQLKKPEKREATNANPLPVEFLRTSLTYLDCMTYVEHVLAAASCTDFDTDYQCFLNRLIDIMFNADGTPLMSHQRNHFTSQWADVNEAKGYLVNIARHHAMATKRIVWLNRVKKNRTFYVEDRFMIQKEPQIVWYFSRDTVLAGKAPLRSGDVIAMATAKEGLDVTHMGFYIEKDENKLLRHASLKLNRVVDQDLNEYLREQKSVIGLMVLRPVLQAMIPFQYRFTVLQQK